MKPYKFGVEFTNLTGWRTDDLRRIILTAIKVYHARVHPFPPALGRWHITVKPRKYLGRWRGYAYIGSRTFVILVPDVVTTVDDKLADNTGRRKYIKGAGKVNPLEVWNITLHELDHCRGLRHGDMGTHTGLEPDWLATFVVRPRAGTEMQEKHAPTPDDKRAARERKIASIDARIKRLETKKKRIDAAIRRARRERAYHERALKKAALTSPTPTERAPQ